MCTAMIHSCATSYASSVRVINRKYIKDLAIECFHTEGNANFSSESMAAYYKSSLQKAFFLTMVAEAGIASVSSHGTPAYI